MSCPTAPPTLRLLPHTALHALVADTLVATGWLVASCGGGGVGDGADARVAAEARRIARASRLLKNEFVYEVGSPFDAIFDRTLERLGASGRSATRHACRCWRLVRDFVESHVVRAGSPGREADGARLAGAGRALTPGAVSRREAISRANFENALDAFKNGGVTPDPAAIAEFLV